MAKEKGEDKKAQEEKKKKEEEIRDKIKKGAIKCNFIFEVIGKPPEFIEQALKGAIENLEKEVGIIMLSKNIEKSKEYQGNADVFSTFAEVELIIENFKKLVELIFDYMPSSVEIFEPEEIKVKISDCNVFLNDLAIRLHQYDITLRQSLIEKDILLKKLEEAKKDQNKK